MEHQPKRMTDAEAESLAQRIEALPPDSKAIILQFGLLLQRAKNEKALKDKIDLFCDDLRADN